MARVAPVRRRALVLALGLTASAWLSACNAFLDDFVYVDAGAGSSDASASPDGTLAEPDAADAGADTSPADASQTPEAATSEDSGPPLTYRAAVLADGPVAYWRLGEAVGPYAYSQTDGAASTGKYTGDVSLGVPGAIAGDPDTAMHLDGVIGSMVLAGGFPLVASPLFAVEVWIRPTATAGAAYNFVTKAIYGNVSLDFFYQEAEGASLHGDEYRGPDGTFANSDTDPAVSSWSYLVFQSDGIKLTIYLNGTPIAIAGLQGTLDADAGDGTLPIFTVGGDENGYSTFSGDIDEVAVYPSPLTTTQMHAHYALATSSDGGT
jgi:hypothetical protein